jgi:hypothetical protein
MKATDKDGEKGGEKDRKEAGDKYGEKTEE